MHEPSRYDRFIIDASDPAFGPLAPDASGHDWWRRGPLVPACVVCLLVVAVALGGTLIMRDPPRHGDPLVMTPSAGARPRLPEAPARPTEVPSTDRVETPPVIRDSPTVSKLPVLPTSIRRPSAAMPKPVAPLNAFAAQPPSHGIATEALAPRSGASAALSASWLATTYVGTPYVWAGGTPKDGFDCSGLVVFVYGVIGVKLPRTTWAMWDVGHHVEKTELRQGDLVFFNGLDHMGIYVGEGRYVHAPHTGDVVKISDLAGTSGYYGAVRLD